MQLGGKELEAEWNLDIYEREQVGFRLRVSPMWKDDEASTAKVKHEKEINWVYFQAVPAKQKINETQLHPRPGYQEGRQGPEPGPRRIARPGRRRPKVASDKQWDQEPGLPLSELVDGYPKPYEGGAADMRRPYKREREQQMPEATATEGLKTETANPFPRRRW